MARLFKPIDKIQEFIAANLGRKKYFTIGIYLLKVIAVLFHIRIGANVDVRINISSSKSGKLLIMHNSITGKGGRYPSDV
jgi:hypothetical protein